MESMLRHAHSGFRWITLILLVVTVVISFINWRKEGSTFTTGMRKLFASNLGMFHLQTLIGIALLFVSTKVQFDEYTMKNAIARFFSVEHPSMMLIAAVLITVGNVKMKKAVDAASKYKTIFIFNLIALLIVLAMIPWPFRNLGTNWF